MSGTGHADMQNRDDRRTIVGRSSNDRRTIVLTIVRIGTGWLKSVQHKAGSGYPRAVGRLGSETAATVTHGFRILAGTSG